MNKADLLLDLLATYRRHGWTLKRVLLRENTLASLSPANAHLPETVVPQPASIDAMWFSRPSHNQCEAWELRLLSETQYALFETFEPDETEEQREEFRQEMEARMRDYVSG